MSSTRSATQRSARRTSKKTTRSTTSAETHERETRLLSITIDPDSAQIVRVEGLDADGARHDLSTDEKAKFRNRLLAPLLESSATAEALLNFADFDVLS